MPGVQILFYFCGLSSCVQKTSLGINEEVKEAFINAMTIRCNTIDLVNKPNKFVCVCVCVCVCEREREMYSFAGN